MCFRQTWRLQCLLLIVTNSLCEALLSQQQPASAAYSTSLPNVTHSGYLAVSKEDGSRIFYTYYESEGKTDHTTPVILWLQGGPGCAGQFGNFLELGPQWVNKSLQLVENPGAWNRRAGLLFVDQPVGTGFSPTGSGEIPSDETEIAFDMLVALMDFFSQHEVLQKRPFIITGESYAGKYVPKIGHFILQAERLHGLRSISADFPVNATLPAAAAALGPPNFRLVALAIGNGLTDPATQVLTHADTAFFSGLIDTQQRMQAMAMQLEVQQAIASGEWQRASSHRGALLQYLQDAIGAGTLLDYRRRRDYDADKLVDKFLNQEEVKEHLGVVKDIVFEGCSPRVEKALSADIMKSVKSVVSDLLASLPMLLYQGEFDTQDGPATSEAWIHTIDWPGRMGFASSHRRIWRADADGTISHFDGDQPTGAAEAAKKEVGRVLGYWREWGRLTHVVVRDAGHLVPHDAPLTAQAMIESWLERSLASQIEQAVLSQ